MQYEFLLFLLLAVFALELVVRRMRLPPAAAFIMDGVVLALVPGVPEAAGERQVSDDLAWMRMAEARFKA